MKCTFCGSEESETLRDGTIRCKECQTILQEPNKKRKTESSTFEPEVIYERREVTFDL